MRNIKYRVFANDNMYLIDNKFLITDGISLYKLDPQSKETRFYPLGIINPVIMQYTGLKDKNGKGEELYHKDLIINSSRNNGDPHVIEWIDKFGGWVGSYRRSEYLIAQELNEIEKVGNFFENKELLK